MDLHVTFDYTASNSKYFSIPIIIRAVSISNNIYFIFYIETEDIDPVYSIVVQKIMKI